MRVPDIEFDGKKYTDITADYHRNGSSGRGFWAILATEPFSDDESDYETASLRWLITYFEVNEGEIEDKAIAVLEVNRLATDGIKFGRNSWRGDNFLGFAKQVIADRRHLWDIETVGKCLRCEDGECVSREAVQV